MNARKTMHKDAVTETRLVWKPARVAFLFGIVLGLAIALLLVMTFDALPAHADELDNPFDTTQTDHVNCVEVDADCEAAIEQHREQRNAHDWTVTVLYVVGGLIFLCIGVVIVVVNITIKGRQRG